MRKICKQRKPGEHPSGRREMVISQDITLSEFAGDDSYLIRHDFDLNRIVLHKGDILEVTPLTEDRKRVYGYTFLNTHLDYIEGRDHWFAKEEWLKEIEDATSS